MNPNSNTSTLLLSPNWIPDKYETRIGSEAPDVDHHDILVESQLVLDGKKIQAYLTHTDLCWCATYASTKTRKQRRSTHVVEIASIFLVRYEQKKDKKANTENESYELFPSPYFSVHFARRGKYHKWKYQSMTFHAADSEQCQLWVDNIQDIVNGYTRPKRLLVFINPVGGKKQAQKIYREKVAPLFDLAKISQNVIVTERVNHAKDYLATEDLSSYNGIISVGGDGMFSEVMNGLLKYDGGEHKTQYSANGKQLAIGLIPAGSTDTVVFCTSGTNDPVTAALHIILGDELRFDICSVWQQDRFLKYSASLMGYGYFGDLAKESESIRWMGPKRYEFAGFKKFMANKSYEGEICFIEEPEADDVEEQNKCKSGCQRCSTFYEDSTDGIVNTVEWKTIHGRFISVIGANISCRCARSSTGLSPHAHNGDGHIDLILIRKTTRTQYLHHLIKVSEKNSDHFDFNFIEVYRVKEFKFRPVITSELTDANSNSGTRDHTNDTSCWNVDGEIVEVPDVHIRVHRQLVMLYARGIED